MSGKNWLERDPSQSPGLRRIQDAAQAAAIAKVQAEQEAREAENRARKAEQERLEMIARIEQKTTQILPLLNEIRDFANKTGTYPVGPDPSSQLELLKDPKPQLLSPSQVYILKVTDFLDQVDLDQKVVEVKYGLKGTERTYIEVFAGRDSCGDSITSLRKVNQEVEMNYGIRLKIVKSGEIQLFRQTVVTIPEQEHRGRLGGGVVPQHTELEETWITISENDQFLRRSLADAFHDPTFLGTGPLPKN